MNKIHRPTMVPRRIPPVIDYVPVPDRIPPIMDEPAAGTDQPEVCFDLLKYFRQELHTFLQCRCRVKLPPVHLGSHDENECSKVA